MKLQIGENLKRLRRAKDMTQEDLAQMLGVSYQSVSRWENGACYPDLELLPLLADFFGVSVDQLMGVNEAHAQQQINQYLDRCQEAISRGQIDACIAIARKGVVEFPTNYTLLLRLMYALFVSGDDSGNIPNWKENKEKYDPEIVSLGQRIMKYCPDQDTRLRAASILAFQHCEMGRKAEARSIYESMPSQEVCRENQMINCLEGPERLPFLRQSIRTSFFNLTGSLYTLTHERLLPDAQLIEVYRKMFALGDILWDYDTAGNQFHLTQVRCGMAATYARLRETEKALEQLELAMEMAHAWDHRPDSGVAHTLLMGDLPWSRQDCNITDTRTCQEIMLEKWLAAEDFDSLRDMPEFQSICSSLSIG